MRLGGGLGLGWSGRRSRRISWRFDTGSGSVLVSAVANGNAPPAKWWTRRNGCARTSVMTVGLWCFHRFNRLVDRVGGEVANIQNAVFVGNTSFPRERGCVMT